MSKEGGSFSGVCRKPGLREGVSGSTDRLRVPAGRAEARKRVSVMSTDNEWPQIHQLSYLTEEKRYVKRKLSIEAGKVNVVWQGFLKIQVMNELTVPTSTCYLLTALLVYAPPSLSNSGKLHAAFAGLLCLSGLIDDVVAGNEMYSPGIQQAGRRQSGLCTAVPANEMNISGTLSGA